MKNNKARRVFAALFLLCVISALATPALAEEPDAWDNYSLHLMEEEIMEWYKLALFLIIPLFIYRLASYGFSIMGTLYLNKGEFQLDKIYKNIQHSVIAVILLVFLPTIARAAISFFAAQAWGPPGNRDLVTDSLSVFPEGRLPAW